MAKKKVEKTSGLSIKAKVKKQAEPPEVTLIREEDLYLFNEGSHFRLYEKLGAHPLTDSNQEGTYFAVWAPDARQISVVGDFNGWDKSRHYLQPKGNCNNTMTSLSIRHLNWHQPMSSWNTRLPNISNYRSNCRNPTHR